MHCAAVIRPVLGPRRPALRLASSIRPPTLARAAGASVSVFKEEGGDRQQPSRPSNTGGAPAAASGGPGGQKPPQDDKDSWTRRAAAVMSAVGILGLLYMGNSAYTQNAVADRAEKDDLKYSGQALAKQFEDNKKYMDSRFDKLEKYIDVRFDNVDVRFDNVDVRFDNVDVRFDKLETEVKSLVAGQAEIKGLITGQQQQQRR